MRIKPYKSILVANPMKLIKNEMDTIIYIFSNMTDIN